MTDPSTRGVGVSFLPTNLFARDLENGTLTVLIDGATTMTAVYSAAFLPDVHFTILPEVAALAQEESWFLGRPQSVPSGLTMAGFAGTPTRHPF